MSANHTNSRICRYFLRGFCRYGSDCWYQHEIPVCMDFQTGECWNGQRCRYRHVLIPKQETCDFSAQTEDFEDDQEADVRLLDTSEAAAAAAASGQHITSEVTCSICIENIFEKNLPEHKTFGILPNCSHVFCAPCIATWRQMDGYSPDVVKGCPVCRVRSDFYLPSGCVVEGEAKEQLAISARQRCREDFCSFEAECGFCPFEENCRYLAASRLEDQEEESEEERDDDDLQFFILLVYMDERLLDEALREITLFV